MGGGIRATSASRGGGVWGWGWYGLELWLKATLPTVHHQCREGFGNWAVTFSLPAEAGPNKGNCSW